MHPIFRYNRTTLVPVINVDALKLKRIVDPSPFVNPKQTTFKIRISKNVGTGRTAISLGVLSYSDNVSSAGGIFSPSCVVGFKGCTQKLKVLSSDNRVER